VPRGKAWTHITKGRGERKRKKAWQKVKGKKKRRTWFFEKQGKRKPRRENEALERKPRGRKEKSLRNSIQGTRTILWRWNRGAHERDHRFARTRKQHNSGSAGAQKERGEAQPYS